MTRFGKESFGIAMTLAAALLVNSHLVRAEPSQNPGQPVRVHKGERQGSMDGVKISACCPRGTCRVSLGSVGTVVNVAARKGERKVRVDVDEAVSIAIGEGASARMHIADSITQPAGAHTSTVRVGTISHTVLGPKASSCIVLPCLEDATVCDAQEDIGTARDQ
jgi:hypothetical protein